MITVDGQLFVDGNIFGHSSQQNDLCASLGVLDGSLQGGILLTTDGCDELNDLDIFSVLRFIDLIGGIVLQNNRCGITSITIFVVKITDQTGRRSRACNGFGSCNTFQNDAGESLTLAGISVCGCCGHREDFAPETAGDIALNGTCGFAALILPAVTRTDKAASRTAFGINITGCGAVSKHSGERLILIESGIVHDGRHTNEATDIGIDCGDIHIGSTVVKGMALFIVGPVTLPAEISDKTSGMGVFNVGSNGDLTNDIAIVTINHATQVAQEAAGHSVQIVDGHIQIRYVTVIKYTLDIAGGLNLTGKAADTCVYRTQLQCEVSNVAVIELGCLCNVSRETADDRFACYGCVQVCNRTVLSDQTLACPANQTGDLRIGVCRTFVVIDINIEVLNVDIIQIGIFGSTCVGCLDIVDQISAGIANSLCLNAVKGQVLDRTSDIAKQTQRNTAVAGVGVLQADVGNSIIFAVECTGKIADAVVGSNITLCITVVPVGAGQIDAGTQHDGLALEVILGNGFMVALCDQCKLLQLFDSIDDQLSGFGIVPMLSAFRQGGVVAVSRKYRYG